MSNQGTRATKKAAVKQGPQTAGQGSARQRVRNAMLTISDSLKAERVQFALLITDQEASLMMQGRVKQGRIGELATGLLNLTSTLVTKTAPPAAS